ncbi:Tetratricopeptide repeat-containing protein [Asanoa hainanensis]|uniref:Tetratricopeptide repeat-containing protein n=1 Tax=Asanoa hainanensis TaxID=560556 RepID=A0A239P874_9ACTN|nr:tetratricopeptide repeat protein [Asanoa hainanensis]SNT62599.1 Tetratricopeptide repeat-containing protein [Asanoa hainanensis]
MRDQLLRLLELAGSPTKTMLKEHADRCEHSVSRAALAGVTADSDSAPRWATVEAFIDACASYASSRRRPLPLEEVDMLVWRARYDQAYPGQRNARAVGGPRQVGLVPGLADCFQPREVLEELAHATGNGGTAVLTGPAGPAASTQLLSGMGGVGKTQLAVHLAKHLYDSGQLDLLVWISATSRQAITASYAQAAVDLALRGADGTDTDTDAARFHAWLSSTDRRWLIVFDDLRAAADLKSLWPPIRPTGRAVITTQQRSSALAATGRRLVPVGVFTGAESVTYLRARLTDHPHLADDLDGLADALHHLPLALAHATAYLIDENVDCTEYQRRLTVRGLQLDELAPPVDALPDDYTRTVAATVSLSVQAADQVRPVGLATPVLRLASVCDPAGIPASMFTTTAAANWLRYAHTLSGQTANPASLDAATIRSGLRVLHRFNLITDAGPTITVHGLVQRVVRDHVIRSATTADDTVIDDPVADLAWTVADALLEAWPSVERDPVLGQAFRTTATAVYRHGGDTLLAPYTHAVLHRAHNSLGNAGDPTGAATAYERLLADQVRVLEPDDPDTLSTRNNLAHWLGAAGDAAGAAAAFEQLLADLVRVLGPDDADTLTARNNLAHWRGEAGNPAGAGAAFEQVLTDRLRVLGPDHPHTLTARNNLARWRGKAGDAAGAATALEQLLADLVRVLGPDHPHTLTARNNLAHWRGEAGDAAGAAAALAQLVADRLRVLGPDHPDILATRADLAHWRGEARDAAGAAAAVEQLVADRMRVLGPDDPDTLTARNNLAHWRGEAGDPAGAAAAFEQLVADRMRVLGPDHPDTLTARHNLAYWRGEAEDPAGAATGREQLLTDQAQVFGPDQADHLAARNNLATRANFASWRGEAGDPAGAAAALEQLVADQVRVLGPDHADTLTARNNLAHWRGEAGDAAGAATEFEHVLADLVRVLGPNHPHTLGTRANLARWRSEAGDAAGAAAALEQLVAGQARVLGPDHPDTLATRGELATFRGKAGDAAGAAAAVEQLAADRLRALGPHHPDTFTARNDLAYWRGEAGDAAGAATALEQLLTDQVQALGRDHPDTLATRGELATWRGEAGDAAGAANGFEQLLTDQVRALGRDHPDTLATRADLAYWRGKLRTPPSRSPRSSS